MPIYMLRETATGHVVNKIFGPEPFTTEPVAPPAEPAVEPDTTEGSENAEPVEPAPPVETFESWSQAMTLIYPEYVVEPDDGTPIWVPPPGSVSPLQFRKAVRALGLKDVFDQFLQMQGPEATDEIEYAVSIQRLHPLIEQARLLLNMTEDDRDNLFRLAHSFA